MKVVLSVRVPKTVEQAVRANAVRSRMAVADIVRLILLHSVDGQFNFSKLVDPPQYLGGKLDVRLTSELVSQVRREASRFGVSVSVYSRVILNAYYTKRLVFVDLGKDRYTLATNREQPNVA